MTSNAALCSAAAAAHLTGQARLLLCRHHKEEGSENTNCATVPLCRRLLVNVTAFADANGSSCAAAGLRPHREALSDDTKAFCGSLTSPSPPTLLFKAATKSLGLFHSATAAKKATI